MNNILFTNVAFNGVVDDDDPDIMVFTRLTPKTLSAAFKAEGTITFDECYQVPAADLQFHIYSPCYLSRNEERKAISLARKANHELSTI